MTTRQHKIQKNTQIRNTNKAKRIDSSTVVKFERVLKI